MAERDRFELDLATALRRYAEDAPTQVRPLELARHLAAAHPHRRSGIGQWRRAAVPRLTWILLMAALLTALLAGTLFVGSQVQRRLPAVVPPVLPAFICPPGSTPEHARTGQPGAASRRGGRWPSIARPARSSSSPEWRRGRSRLHQHVDADADGRGARCPTPSLRSRTTRLPT